MPSKNGVMNWWNGVSEKAASDAEDWANSEEQVGRGAPTDLEKREHALQYDEKYDGKKGKGIIQKIGKKPVKKQMHLMTDDDLRRMAAYNAQKEIAKAQKEGMNVNHTVAKKVESKYQVELLNKRNAAIEKHEMDTKAKRIKERRKTHGRVPKPSEMDGIGHELVPYGFNPPAKTKGKIREMMEVRDKKGNLSYVPKNDSDHKIKYMGYVEGKTIDGAIEGKTKQKKGFFSRFKGKPKQLYPDAGSHDWKPTGGAFRKGASAMKKGADATASLGYSLPGPFQVFTLAWQKMTASLKLLIVLVFAVVLLFVPWGVFYYAGWALGAAFMFLLSLIFWVFVSFFNGIAYVMVSIINAVVTIIMSVVIFVVEAVLSFFTMGGTKTIPNPDPYAIGNIVVNNNYWTEGHRLMHSSLLRYDQLASVPSLMTVVSPGWQSWMNDTLIGHVLGLLGISLDMSWITDPFKVFYGSLSPEHAMIVGLIFIAIPVALLLFVYFRNRHHLH